MISRAHDAGFSSRISHRGLAQGASKGGAVNNLKEEIIGFIHEINEYEDFEDDTDLFEEDILDSLTLVLLINTIENKLSVFIPEEVVTLENFSTVNKITKLVEDLKKA